MSGLDKPTGPGGAIPGRTSVLTSNMLLRNSLNAGWSNATQKTAFVVLTILLLCVTDAFLTLILLQSGAHEANPVMATVVYKDASTFTMLKMLMTSCSVAVMVMLAGYRFLGVFRVELLLYLVLSGYVGLVGYELWMLGEIDNWPLHL